MVEQNPKTTAGRRTITVPDWVMTMLAEHLAVRGVTGSDPARWVFVSPEGRPLHYNNWRRRVWVPAVATAGFNDLTFHDLKHTAGPTLVEEGVNVKTAQARLGHANPQTTLRIYAQATDRADPPGRREIR
jgi:integrase